MKVLGATRARIAGIFAWEFAALGLATALAALGVGTLGAYLGGAPPDGARLDLPARRRRRGRAGRHGAYRLPSAMAGTLAALRQRPLALCATNRREMSLLVKANRNITRR